MLLDNETHEQLKTAFAVYVKESERFERQGVKISAQRARQALNEMKRLITQRRQELQEKKLQT
jgi:hypothetical protein